MEQFNVWFTVSEVQGLVKSGGLADVAKALPQALKALHQQVAHCAACLSFSTGKGRRRVSTGNRADTLAAHAVSCFKTRSRRCANLSN